MYIRNPWSWQSRSCSAWGSAARDTLTPRDDMLESVPWHDAMGQTDTDSTSYVSRKRGRWHGSQWQETVSGRQCFEGKDVQVVQVGLGTNATFIQNLCDDSRKWNRGIAWLLEVVSEPRPQHVTGVAVEPVFEHFQALQGGLGARLPNVALLCAALGEHDCRGVDVYVLTGKTRKSLLREVNEWQRPGLERHLEYIQNMSCVGHEHPEFQMLRQRLFDEYKVQVNLDRVRVDMLSWECFCSELDFGGCELLIIESK